MTLESRPLSAAGMVGVMMGESKKDRLLGYGGRYHRDRIAVRLGLTPPWRQRIVRRLSRRADEA